VRLTAIVAAVMALAAAAPAAAVVPDGDATLMSAAITRVLDDPGEHERRRVQGLAWAATFTWGRAAAKTVDVYRAAIKR